MVIITEIIMTRVWVCGAPHAWRKKKKIVEKIVEKIDVGLDKSCRKTLI